MKKIGEFWVPDVDAADGTNLEKTKAAFLERAGCQVDNLIAALKLVPGREVAIDGGANVGSWTKQLAAHFSEVHSFEPNPSAFECLDQNVRDWGLASRVVTHRQALSDREERVCVEPPKQGRRTVTSRVTGPGDTEAVTIDSLALKACSLIKLDLEGYEVKALLGAADTLRRLKPWVLIENKKTGLRFFKTPAERQLHRFGYKPSAKFGDGEIDWLFRPSA